MTGHRPLDMQSGRPLEGGALDLSPPAFYPTALAGKSAPIAQSRRGIIGLENDARPPPPRRPPSGAGPARRSRRAPIDQHQPRSARCCRARWRAATAPWPAGRHDPVHLTGAPGQSLRHVPGARRRSCSRATPTTMSARACQAGVIVVRQPPGIGTRVENIIVGNTTVLYGAIAARPISTAWRANASRCKLRRGRGRRGRRRSRLRNT